MSGEKAGIGKDEEGRTVWRSMLAPSTVVTRDLQHRGGVIHAHVQVLDAPAVEARITVLHAGGAYFNLVDVPGLKSKHVGSGWFHGTIDGDIAPINAARDGFVDCQAFHEWRRVVAAFVMDLDEIADRRAALLASTSKIANAVPHLCKALEALLGPNKGINVDVTKLARAIIKA